MTPDEIAARLRGGGVKLAFDTNALYSEHALGEVCNNVSRWNDRLAALGHGAVELIICTVAHAEKLFDLKQQFRGRFSRDVILRGLARKGLRIEAFDIEHALETARRLGERYPDTDAWHRAKRDLCMQCLGLHSSKVQPPGSGRTCGATVDWLIGAHACREGCLLVTADTDVAFSGLTDRVKLDNLRAALKTLLEDQA